MKTGKKIHLEMFCASIMHDSVLSLKEGGISGFYHGLTPTIIGMAPYAGYIIFYFM